MVVLDTNIIIDHLRLPKGVETSLLKITKSNPDDIFSVSVISVQELYQGKSSKRSEKENDMVAILGSLKILTYNFKIAKLAGEMIRDSTYPIGLADAAIAATVIVNRGQLATLDKKDFSGIKDLTLL